MKKSVYTPFLIIAFVLVLIPVASYFDNNKADKDNQETVNICMQVDQKILLNNGLEATDKVIGDGAEIQAGDQISVYYHGTLEDGTVFDSSRDRQVPFEFEVGVGYVIPGWEIGILGQDELCAMKVGGKRILKIPADLGYGDTGAGDVIPGGATLIFEVEILGVNS